MPLSYDAMVCWDDNSWSVQWTLLLLSRTVLPGAGSLNILQCVVHDQWSKIPIDLVKDQACTLATYAGLNPEVEGKTYMLNANEGDDVGYEWEEKMKLRDVVEPNGTPLTASIQPVIYLWDFETQQRAHFPRARNGI